MNKYCDIHLLFLLYGHDQPGKIERNTMIDRFGAHFDLQLSNIRLYRNSKGHSYCLTIESRNNKYFIFLSGISPFSEALRHAVGFLV